MKNIHSAGCRVIEQIMKSLNLDKDLGLFQVFYQQDNEDGVLQLIEL